MHKNELYTQLGLTVVVCAATLTIGACSSSSDMGAMATVPSTQAPQPTSPSTGEVPGTGAANETPAGTDSPSPVTDTPTDTSGGETPDSANSPQSPDVEASLIAGASNVACDASVSDFQQTMLAVVNNSRRVARMCGSSNQPAVDVVSWNPLLAAAALNHAGDMVSFNFFDHTGSDGLGVSDRAESAGYSWRAIGENIAAGQSDVEQVHEGWLDSPGHCRNIMSSLFTEVGAACITSDDVDFQSYWVVVFGDTL